MLLTDFRIKRIEPKKKAFRVSDGDGLYLQVTPTGKKTWQLRYRFAGKERMISCGSYPRVGLREARDLRHRSRQLLGQNIDPCSEKHRLKLEAKFRDENSFQRVAVEWFNSRKAEWTPRHARKIWHRLEQYIFPDLGKRAIAEIKPLEVLRVIQKIEDRDATELSHCQLSVCSRIFRYAVVTGRLHYNPASDLGCALRRHRVRHHPALRPRELGDFLRAFRSFECNEVHKIAFELLLLTALRTGELRFSKWVDIDFERWEWVLPPGITKMKDEHIVPLSEQAVKQLRHLKDLTGYQEWLFPNQDRRKHPVISENFANNMIRKMGYRGKVVGHGFRSMFSTVLNEAGFNRDAIERQLAHKERNKVRAAYNHAEYWEVRGPMMQWWADFLDKAREEKPSLESGRSPFGYIKPALMQGRGEPERHRFGADLPIRDLQASPGAWGSSVPRTLGK